MVFNFEKVFLFSPTEHNNSLQKRPKPTTICKEESIVNLNMRARK
jgi:hypothetical protein